MTIQQLIKKNKGKVKLFKELDLESKLAIIWYMAINGEAWKIKSLGIIRTRADQIKYKNYIISNIKKFDSKYGNLPFGIVNLPLSDIKEYIVNHFLKNGISRSFQSWIAEYIKNWKPRVHRNFKWPVILSSDEHFDNIFQDGYHRFADYVRRGATEIKSVYYIDGIEYFKDIKWK